MKANKRKKPLLILKRYKVESLNSCLISNKMRDIFRLKVKNPYFGF